MATTRWLISLNKYLRQCGFTYTRLSRDGRRTEEMAISMEPDGHGWVILSTCTGTIAAIVVDCPTFPPRDKLRAAVRAAAPLTRVA